MVSVPCIVDNSNGFFLFILSLCRLVVFREHILVFFRKFWIVWVPFETVLFVSVVSIKVRNTETNRKFFFLVSRNKPKQTRNRSCFGLFRFEPKFIFVCFEDTLLVRTLECRTISFLLYIFLAARVCWRLLFLCRPSSIF
jgi:hypothetical protein